MKAKRRKAKRRKPLLKPIEIQIAWANHLDRAAWKANPIYRSVRAYPLDALWAVRHDDGDTYWRLTHRPTGFYAGAVSSFQVAKKLWRALLRAVPAKHWRFDDESVVRFNPTFQQCKAIIAKYEAMEA